MKLPGISKGTLALDEATGRTDVYQGVHPVEKGPDAAYLRPVGGGCEWTTEPGNVRSAQQ